MRLPAFSRKSRERDIYYLFEIGVILKGLDALIELALGFLLLFVNVTALVYWLTEGEIIEDPTDFIANHLRTFSQQVSPGTQYYASLYLLLHGVVKIVVVWGLLQRKPWAYPASLAVFGLLVAYQIFSIAQNFSPELIALTALDAAFMWLIWHEYRRAAR